MNYSKSEFLELLDQVSKLIEYVYYPDIPHKKMEKKLKSIKKNVEENGLDSILTESKTRL